MFCGRQIVNRRLVAAGASIVGAFGLSMQANAITRVYEINGTFGAAEQGCTQITLLFGGSDCTFGRNRAGASGTWIGGLFAGGHYPQDGVHDQPSYVPTSGVFDRPSQTFAPAAPDGKIAAPVSGTFTIDDNGTPGNPADDLLSANFSIGTMARNIATGQSTRVVQRWTTMDHVMAPTAVNATATVANGAGGVDYVIGTRGFPTSRCSKTNASDCFPTANSSAVFTDLDNTPAENAVSFWVQIPVGQVGIERVGLLGDPNFVLVQPPPNPKTGNVGATSTATFTGYSCSYNSLSANDCASGAVVWGAGEPAGFDNMIMKVSTDSTGAITSSRIYWTEEYFIGFGGAPPGYDNSYQAGAIDFTDVAQSLPPPPNDQFANRTALSGSVTVGGTNISATGEGGEPDHALVSLPFNSVWWSWSSPVPGQLTVSTLGSDFDTTLAVYVGGVVSSLTEVASNDDFSGLTSRVSFRVTPGTAYAIAVDGFESLQGYINLNLGFVPDPIDSDGDGILDTADNCILVPNPSQCDSDNDGYGNHCDADLNNDGFTNGKDTTLYRLQIGQPSVAPIYNKADMNCNGFVNGQDTTLFRKRLGLPPGSSGLVP